MKIFNGTDYREMCPVEKSAMIKNAKLAALQQRTQPLNDRDVLRLVLAKQINELDVDDNTALRMADYFPAWTAGTGYCAGFMIHDVGRLWRCLQEHTSQTGWEPENAPALWEQVCWHYEGTADDPIPYEGNMLLENGKHYCQNGEIYRCIRDSENPVYHSLAELVGLYVEAV